MKERGTSWSKYKTNKYMTAKIIENPVTLGPGKYDPKLEIHNTYKEHA